LPAVGLEAVGLVHPHPSQRRTIYKVLHTTSSILQSNAPEDGHNYCPKHVELTFAILINCLLLHLVDCFSILHNLMMQG